MVWPSMIGLGNQTTMSGHGMRRAAFNAAFGIGENGESSRHENVIWDTNGAVRKLLAYWIDGIVSVFKHIGLLRQQIEIKDKGSKDAAKESKELKAALEVSQAKRKQVEEMLEEERRGIRAERQDPRAGGEDACCNRGCSQEQHYHGEAGHAKIPGQQDRPDAALEHYPGARTLSKTCTGADLQDLHGCWPGC